MIGVSILYIGFGRAVHHLDAARLRRRHPGRARGGRHGRRPQPHPGASCGSPSRCSRPGLVASGVYAFLQAWNEFTVALVRSARRVVADPAAVVARVHPGQRESRRPTGVRSWPRRRSSPIPVIIFFLFVQGRHDQRAGQRGGEGMSVAGRRSRRRHAAARLRGHRRCPSGCAARLSRRARPACACSPRTSSRRRNCGRSPTRSATANPLARDRDRRGGR